MRYTLDSVLPIGAFQPRGGVFAKGMTLHGGGGSFIEDIGGAVGDVFEGAGDVLGSVAEGVGDVVGDVGEAIGDVGVAIDEGVNDAIPGGWATVAAVAAAVATGYVDPSLLAAEGALTAEGALAAEGALTTGEILGSGGFTAAEGSGASFVIPEGAAYGTAIAPEIAPEILPEIAEYAGDAAYEAQGLQEGYESAANALGDVTNPDGSITSTFDDGSTITRVGSEIIETTEALSDPLRLQDLKNAYNVYKAGKTAYGLANALTGGSGNLRASSPLYRTTGLSNLLGGQTGSSGSSALPGNLEATSLAAAPVTQGSNMNLNQLKQLYPQLSTIDPRLVQTLAGRTTANNPFSALSESQDRTQLSTQGQGGTPSAGYPAIAADKAANTTKFMGNPLSGSFDALTSAGLHSISGGALPSAGRTYGLKDGGQPHVPQFKTGTTGHYVQGAGDGQSDDIPAMLADGEYVFDADTVASLGNGSNKAGALQLDKMREAIRKHKRSAPHNKIPPKAKSPLEYLKGK